MNPRNLLLVVFLLLLPAVAGAQVGSATDILRGRVTDQEGTPLPGALVEAWSQQSGIRRATSTDAEGRYTIVFPDGGGRYRLRVSALGTEPQELELSRAADEEVLLRDVRLSARPLDVREVVADARRAPPPGRGEAGSTSRGLGSDLTQRLPLDSTDPAALASLVPGVVSIGGADSIGGGAGFSIAGQRASQNQVTLDGATFASMLSGAALGGGLGLPQEGMRSTQVITNTYDVARGQFSGGQVAMTTQAGTNTRQGSVSYRHGGDRLQAGSGLSDWSGGFSTDRLSGGFGGAFVRDRLFYNVSFAAQRRGDDLFALAPRSPAGFGALGAHPDSVARFLDIIGSVHGVPLEGQTGPYRRVGDAVSTLARLDWNPVERHSVSLRAFATRQEMREAFVRPLDLLENGGQMANDSRGAVATATSRLGGSWVNEARVSYTSQEQELSPSVEMPEGRVRVSSGTGPVGGVSFLAFGGDPFPPRSTAERTWEVANELSLLLGDSHRLKVGGLVNHTRFEQQSALARQGVFTFESLADLEAGRATSFTRSLLNSPTTGSGWNSAFYVGDTWRPREPLQIVFGLRAEAAGFGGTLQRRDDAFAALGLDSGHTPSEVHVSPRAGFSWRLSPQGRPLRIVRGGFGEFRGRTPYALFAGALDGARDGGESILSCVGAGIVPAADFRSFRENPASIPSTCADGGSGSSAAALPNVTGFASDFAAPRSWRGSLGYQTAPRPGISLSADLSYARGVSQYGVRDLNRRGTPAFELLGEGGRPVYALPNLIDRSSGAVPLSASRRDSRFGHAYEVHSDLVSEAAAFTLAASGLLLRSRTSFQASYTLASARDQSSFTFGGPADGYVRTLASPGDGSLPWSASDTDRRHAFTAMLGRPVRTRWELSLIGRASSGAPFTPRAAGDVNGDGVRNDPAFVFDPATVADPQVAEGMRRLLENAPGGAARCLEGQLGQVAARNSCRGAWSYSLDARIGHTPTIGTLGRRLSLAVDVYNLPAGLDLAFNGSSVPRGWGRGGMMVDQTLLHTRGFDPQTNAFRYEVNERFGRDLASSMGMRSPFGVQIAARIALGPNPTPDPLGGFAGLGLGAAGGTTRVTMMVGGGGEAPAGGGNTQMRFGGGGDGTPAGPGAMLDMFLPMPLDGILALRDSLGFSPEQVEEIQRIRRELIEKNTPIRAEVARVLGGNAGVGNPAAAFERVGPRLNEGRQNVQTALDRVKEVLTAEQWEALPQELRSVTQRQIRMRGE